MNFKQVFVQYVRLSFHKLVTFSSSSQEPLGQFQLSTKHPWVERIQVCSNEGPTLRDNYKIGKIH